MSAKLARYLLDIGLDAEQIVGALEAVEDGKLYVRGPHDAAAEKRRAYDRDRKRAERVAAKSGGNPVDCPVDTETEIPSEVSPHTPLPNYPIPSLRSGNNAPARIREGWPKDYRDQFWLAYPAKTAKKAGLKALDRIALAKSGPSFAELMAGLERYVRTKPPDWAWAHAATWLNGERWTDEAEIIPIKRQAGAGNGVREATDALRDAAAQLRAESEDGFGFGTYGHDARLLSGPG